METENEPMILVYVVRRPNFHAVYSTDGIIGAELRGLDASPYAPQICALADLVGVWEGDNITRLTLNNRGISNDFEIPISWWDSCDKNYRP